MGAADEAIKALPASYPNVVVADWAAVSGTPGYTYNDGLHLKPDGATGLALRHRRGRRAPARRRLNGFAAVGVPPVVSPVVSEPTSTPRTEPFKAPVGTRDVLPPESDRWQALIATFAQHVGRAGYGLVQSPMFEEIGVFARMGEGTDVVRKEMYDFLDKGERHLALRPEGTASVARAYVQHRPATPVEGLVRRAELPLRAPPGRPLPPAPPARASRPSAPPTPTSTSRSSPCCGTSTPASGCARSSSSSTPWAPPTTAVATSTTSAPTWRARSASSTPPTPRRSTTTRCGCSTPSARSPSPPSPTPPASPTASPTRASPTSSGCRPGSRALGIPFRIEPRLVRGLDYYTHTTFEFISGALDAAQSTIGGGGRYDGLVESLGGPSTPGIGFGSGIERTLLTCDAEGVFPVPEQRADVYVVDTAGGDTARDLSVELRRAGIAAERAFDGRSMKSQMKSADRSGAAIVLIVGSDELADGTVTVRHMRGDHEQQRVERVAVVATVAAMLLDLISG